MNEFLISLLRILNEMSPYILFGFLIAGILHVFVSAESLGRHLSGRGWSPVVKAALFGIPLPLCSCGVLPTAVALRNRGASKGASTAFLIATPQTGIDSITATYALLGLPFAILRPLGALAGAFLGGMAVDRFDRHDVVEVVSLSSDNEDRPRGFWRKVAGALRYGFVDMVGSVGKWLVIGLFVAALITVFMPDELLVSLSRYPLAAMLLMVAIAVPMYVCATGSIPIALSLMIKGLSPGAAFVLLMAGPAANFASVLILRRSLGSRSTAIYIGSVVVTALVFGMIIDMLLPGSWFAVTPVSGEAACHMNLFPLFPTICSVILTGLLIYAFAKRMRPETLRKKESINNVIDMKTVYDVKGMACNHCKATVEKTLLSLDGVEAVTVELASGKVSVEGEVAPEVVADAINNAGFECVLPA